MHEANSFVTLTYDDAHLPPDGSLRVEHWQKFAKRLRKKAGPFRFFHAGEYGDRSGRPHYHAVMFGLDFAGDRQLWKNAASGPLFVSPLLERTWGHGFAVIGNLTFESAAYVARYCTKKVTGPNAEEHYQRACPLTGEVIRLKPEYTTMSRGGRNSGGGIGAEWFRKYHSDVYPADEVISRGFPAQPPKFYDGMYELVDQVGYDQVKARRKARAEKRADPARETREALDSRERVARARIEFFARTGADGGLPPDNRVPVPAPTGSGWYSRRGE